VIGFLINAGLNGLKNSRGCFLRWSFNDLRKYYIPLHTLLYLLIALLMVIALAVLNTAISAIGGAKALFTSEPAWLTQKLFDDYSTVLSLVVGMLELFTAATLIGMLLSRVRKWLILRLSAPVSRGLMLIVGLLSVILFAASVIAIVDAALAVPTLYRLKGALPRWMTCAAAIVQAWQLWSVLAAGIVVAGYFVLTVIRSYISQLSSRAAAHWPAHVALLSFVLLLVSVWLLVRSLSPGTTAFTDVHQWRILLMWGVLVILSLIVRTFLIEYLGDVVAYVEPHKLDRFAELRTQIKDRVLKIAQAIYAERGAGGHFEYHRVVLVGHSLGSAIVYDTLNRLLLDDQAVVAAGRPWNVSGRSPYLLTFGSPLNKIAFIFATQSKKGSMTLARERLASLVQPLIDSEVIRAGIRWVNLYSPWDIISGRLDFYDPPPGGPASAVLDERDPDATTFLAAHTEYWRNTSLFAWLHAMV
jgi:MFS family permease